MKTKIEIRTKFWAILLNPLLLILYVVGLWQFDWICKYGGVKKHLIVIAFCIGIAIVWIVAWINVYFRRKRKGKIRVPAHHKFVVVIVCVEVFMILAASLFYGASIMHSANTGKLSWKLQEWKHNKNNITIKLTHNNIFEDGVDGIFKDLSKKINLPENLYLLNEFSVKFNEDGTITEIYSFFYGKDSNGTEHTYLLDYDSSKSSKMTVVPDGNANCTYEETMKMQPLLDIVNAADIQSYTTQWNNSDDATQFEILYYGYRSLLSEEGVSLQDTDGKFHELNEDDVFYGEIAGYQVSLYVPGNDDITPVRFLNASKRPTIVQEQSKTQTTAAQEEYKVGTIAGKSFEQLYYLINKNLGWRLKVVDSACGSRFYALEETQDGGSTWTRINEDPFKGNGGTAEGIIYFTDQIGYIGISTASRDHSTIYVTRDGGTSFSEVKLPISKGASDVLDINDYDYVEMPVIRDNVLTIAVRQEYDDNENALVFESTDNGLTWNYAGFKKMD